MTRPVGGEADRDPRVAAAWAEVRPYVVAVGGVGLLGTPVEAVTPILRRMRGLPGVALGPGLVTLANGMVAAGVVRVARTRAASGKLPGRIPGWAVVGGAAYLVAAPAAAISWQRAVVLRNRSALWGWGVSPIGLLQTAVVLVALRRVRRARAGGATGGGTRSSTRGGGAPSKPAEPSEPSAEVEPSS